MAMWEKGGGRGASSSTRQHLPAPREDVGHLAYQEHAAQLQTRFPSSHTLPVSPTLGCLLPAECGRGSPGSLET